MTRRPGAGATPYKKAPISRTRSHEKKGKMKGKRRWTYGKKQQNSIEIATKENAHAASRGIHREGLLPLFLNVMERLIKN